MCAEVVQPPAFGVRHSPVSALDSCCPRRQGKKQGHAFKFQDASKLNNDLLVMTNHKVIKNTDNKVILRAPSCRTRKEEGVSSPLKNRNGCVGWPCLPQCSVHASHWNLAHTRPQRAHAQGVHACSVLSQARRVRPAKRRPQTNHAVAPSSP